MWHYIKSLFYSEKFISVNKAEIIPHNKQIITSLNPYLKGSFSHVFVPVTKTRLEYYNVYHSRGNSTTYSRVVYYTDHEIKDKYDTVVDYNPTYQNIQVYNIKIESNNIIYTIKIEVETIEKAREILNNIGQTISIKKWILSNPYVVLNGSCINISSNKPLSRSDTVKIILEPLMLLSFVMLGVIISVHAYTRIKSLL